MAEGKKIIATDTEISREIADKVAKESRNKFEIRDLGAIEPRRKDDVEVLMVRNSGLIGPKIFEEFPNVRLLQSLSAGVDFINIDSIPRKIILSSNAGAYKEPIAEHVFGMVLYFAKNYERNHQRLRRGTFDNSPDAIFLAGKTIGIVGAGGIGQSVARVAKALNLRTLGVNTSGKPVPNFDAVWKMDRLDDLLKEADFVVISIPLNVHTRNLIKREKVESHEEGCDPGKRRKGRDNITARPVRSPQGPSEFQSGDRCLVGLSDEGGELLARLPVLRVTELSGQSAHRRRRTRIRKARSEARS